MITVYSTFVEDTLIKPNGQLINKSTAGPAFWIEQQLKKHNINYNLKTGNILTVEIIIANNQETGTITSKNITSQSIKYTDSPIIIDTLSNEWIIKDPLPENNLVFLDIQGFARSNRMHANTFDYTTANWDNLFCLKGTAEEIAQLPNDIVENQKKRCLIITDGKNGFIIYYKNKQHNFKAKEKVNTKDSLGAGDTFLTAFVTEFEKTKNIEQSAKFANNEVVEFLKTK